MIQLLKSCSILSLTLQTQVSAQATTQAAQDVMELRARFFAVALGIAVPVSYTHLTLPTKRIV